MPPRARSTFSIIAIFIGILSGSLCGGESLEIQRKSPEMLPLTNQFHDSFESASL